MQTHKIEFKAGTVIELYFATIINGKEDQLFDDYFPKVMPIVAELKGQPLGSYRVANAASKLGTPLLGALFQWSDISGFEKLHKDPRFMAIKGIRDETLSFFSNAHFFSVDETTEVAFEENQEYALIADWGNFDNSGLNDLVPLVSLSGAKGAPDNGFQASQVHIARWDEISKRAFEAIKFGQSNSHDVFKIIMNMPA